MGARKKISAEKRKEALKSMYFAKLQNVPTSPRKMRLVADMIRGMEVNRALGVLKFSSKEAAARVEKLLRSAIANWEQKKTVGRETNELKTAITVFRPNLGEEDYMGLQSADGETLLPPAFASISLSMASSAGCP